MDTSALQVKWLGDEYMKQEVQGSSAGGRQTCVFRAKNRMTSDLGRVTMWLSSVVSPDIKKILIF
jgi:hypothetical protein